MADVKLSGIREGRTIEEKVQNLEDTVTMLRKELDFLLQNIDSTNVTRLNTNITKIKSEHGETELIGPLLLMKDSQGTPVVRIKMGHDKDSEEFVFRLMNAIGDITVNLDTNGNLVVERGTFKGSITIGTGNDVFKAGTEGIWLGHAEFVSAPFKVSKDGEAVATNLVITGGSISVDTDLYVGNNIFLGNMDSNDKNIYLFSNGENLCSISFDADNNLVLRNWGNMQIEASGTLIQSGESIDISGDSVVISSGSGGSMLITKIGSDDFYVTHGGSGELKIGHSGSGTLRLQHAGSGVLKIESDKNMSIESKSGEVFALGVWRLSVETYIGETYESNRVLKKSEIEALLSGGESGIFTTADGKTVIVSDGRITAIV